MEQNRPAARAARTTVPIAVAAGALVLAGAGGAVAGGMITGAQIKDGTVTSADVRNGSLGTHDLTPATRQKLSRVLGYEHLDRTADVAGGASRTLYISCNAGKALLSATASWLDSSQAVQVEYDQFSTGATAYAKNPGAAQDTLKIEAICAPVSGPLAVADSPD